MPVADVVRGPDRSPRCGDCPLAGVGGTPLRPVRGEGAAAPRWIAVGEGPGTVEAMEGRPFVGPSGRMFARILKALDCERGDIWITNATLCSPRSKSESELKLARECCAPRLESELEQFPGVPVLTMGAVAAGALLGGHFRLSEMAGTLNTARDGRDVIPTHHPARILRGGDGKGVYDRAVDLLYYNLVYDAGKVNALGRGDHIRFTDDVEIEVSDPNRAARLLRDVYAVAKRAGFIASDCETDALGARTANLTALAFATTESGVSIAYEALGDEAWSVIDAIARDPGVEVVFHNRLYDELVGWRYEIDLAGPVGDTLLQHHAAFPGTSHKLQDVATQFFAIRPWKSEFRKGLDERGRPDTVENLLIYNCRDALVTARLKPCLDDAIDKTDSRRAYDIDNKLAPYALKAEMHGVPVHLPTNAELHTHFQQLIAAARADILDRAHDPALRETWIDQLAMIRALQRRKHDPPGFLDRHAVRVMELEQGKVRKKTAPGLTRCVLHGESEIDPDVDTGQGTYDYERCCDGDELIYPPRKYLKGKGPTYFQISNPDHVAAYLKARGHRLWRLTAGGKPSTAKDVLEDMAHIPEVRTILTFREAAKLDSTFVTGLPLSTIDWRTGEPLPEGWALLHPSWDIHKITGRWGSSPATQNWPKQNMRGRPNLRRQVRAMPGRKLVGADKAQLEARVIGLLSGDEFLCSIFTEGYGSCPGKCDPAKEPTKFCPVHDIHTVFAVEVFPGFMDYPKEGRKELRDLVKRGEYGGFYKGSVDTLYQSIVKEFPDVKFQDVARIVKIIANRMPGVDLWHKELVRQAMAGEIRSAIFGRRRTFPLGHFDLSVVVNFPVQATAADIFDLDLLAVCEALPDIDPSAAFIIHGHDAAYVDCAEDHADAVASMMTREMSREVVHNGTRMFFPAEAKVADTWDKL